MKKRGFLFAGNVARKAFNATLLGASVWAFGINAAQAETAPQGKTVLLNVAYDVIRDFYKAYNQAYSEAHPNVSISQSHGGASKQALSVAHGLPADVVTLTQSYDIDLLVKQGLVDADWQQKLPNNATPFGSVSVFLVRKGNPKQIKDWSDLVRDDVKVVFANPKTSSNGRFAYLSAVVFADKAFGQDQTKVKDFLTKLLSNVPVLDAGARGATISFTQNGLGDVLITPENEAAIAANVLGKDKFDVVYPSIGAQTPVLVAEVNKNTSKKGSHDIAYAYLQHLWSEPAQELAAKNYFRPSDPAVLAKYQAQFPSLQTFSVESYFGSWDKVSEDHFKDGALFDQLLSNARK